MGWFSLARNKGLQGRAGGRGRAKSRKESTHMGKSNSQRQREKRRCVGLCVSMSMSASVLAPLLHSTRDTSSAPLSSSTDGLQRTGSNAVEPRTQMHREFCQSERGRGPPEWEI